MSPHPCSVSGRNFVFGEVEREMFAVVLRQVEAFSGLRVLTWTMLSNHFHLLVEVTRPEPLTDVQILARCRALYSREQFVVVKGEYRAAAEKGGRELAVWREGYLRRMWDLGEFMKTLKQKFTTWFNRRHGREGTLWERRYVSVMVEGGWNPLLTVAAYIDLNAVRAGMVADPAEYRWCGYAEALAGKRSARLGLLAVMRKDEPQADWRQVRAAYRKVMYGIGEETAAGRGLSAEVVREVWETKGELTLGQLLRCRVKHFSAGLAVGGKAYLDGMLATHGSLFGPGRESVGRKIPGGDWQGLQSGRDIGRRGIEPPPG